MSVTMGIPICPITQEIMIEPVMDHEGNTYEKKAILEWLKINKTSPVTRNIITKQELIPNRALADLFNYCDLQKTQDKNITNCSKCDKSMAVSNKYKGNKKPLCYICRGWACKNCTFVNNSSEAKCELCEEKR